MEQGRLAVFPSANQTVGLFDHHWTAGSLSQPTDKQRYFPSVRKTHFRVVTPVWREFGAGDLTRASRDVLLTLKTYSSGRGEDCWPAHATLAERCKCSIRAVQRALAQARLLDLVSWSERRFKAGWRWLRTSNLYRLIVPSAPVAAGMRARRTTGHLELGGEIQKEEAAQECKKTVLVGMMESAGKLPNLLIARQKAFLVGQRTVRASM
jgi:hypothetical protein